ncbi:protein CHLOROPLAST IMPORT APPARATUS 2 [Sesamum alatum]|uniref:Protein CHLOROPLAST IMPORT APPARATUS 2 n=1 Tax=Sesamum alatum TaxID=300844 RepID=A0AAE2CL23_9LAMI|nr:protein CHLOROPLAST IMPORT APPARATUS 2 [Sesamum alatum]
MNRKRRPRPRKSATKPKKPKFLSLRRQFPATETDEIKRLSGKCPNAAAPADNYDPHHLDLFRPLQSENQVEDRESHDHENVAFFFSATDGGATTLTGLLDTSTVADSNSSHTDNNSSRLENLSPSSASLTYAYSEDRAALVRMALRNRERESGEEKWVSYSEVVKRKVKEEEVSSSAAVDLHPAAGTQGLWLKLDYEEIMNAWSNKGPLYVEAESSQIVPDINHYFLSHEEAFNNVYGVRWGCNTGLWAVPEMAGDVGNGEMTARNGEEIRSTLQQREASVLRYKEKRQNRLFSRKIRYQVRKLNADKRPRLKGRFVKRS